jgi:hypothetical protein
MTHISIQPIRFIVDPTVLTVYYVVMNQFPTTRDKVIGIGVGLGVLAGMLFFVKIVQMFAPYSLIPVGAGLWYFWYVAECAINGGQTAGTYPFQYARDDFLNNFGPVHKQLAHRMKLSNGDREWAGMYPGKLHCIFTHICLPLAPITIWWLVH